MWIPLMYYYYILFLLTQLLCQQNQTFWLVAQPRAVYEGYVFASTTMTVMSNWHQFDLHNCVLPMQTPCQQETTYCDDTHSILCFVLSAFIYVNSIITRGHFPTFYDEITFSANKQEENIIAEELGIFCHSQLLVKESERALLVVACLFVCFSQFILRTDRYSDDLKVCL